MSELERACIPLVGNLMQDLAISLDGSQQHTIAMWSMKMAMLTEFISRGQRQLFYSKQDREQLRVASNLPTRTSVWLARHSVPNQVGVWGTDAWSLNKDVHAYVHSILVGHLAIQVLTLHVSGQFGDTPVEVNPMEGPRPWPDLLVRIWPTVRSAEWPPRFSFRDRGALSLMTLIRRYSYGEPI